MKVNVEERAAMGEKDVSWTEREKEDKSEEEDEGEQTEGGWGQHSSHS